MSAPTLFRTSTFRLALFYSGLFSVSGLLLLGLLYWLTLGFIYRPFDDRIRAESRDLLALDQRQGRPALVETIGTRGRDSRGYFDLLVDARLHPIAGTLESWPYAVAIHDGWVEFAADDAGARAATSQASQDIRALVTMLPDGSRLLVGRDMHDLRESRELVFAAFGWIIAGMIGVGLAGGWVVSRNVMRRVDAINRTAGDIMRGDLRARMPTTTRGDEFDQMSANINRMLDRIEALMAGMKQVSDGIAHDLRSPLTRLRGRLELALLSQSDAAQYRGAIEDAIAETDNLLGTFVALLSIAEAEAGAARQKMTPVDLGSLIRDVADLYEPLAQAKGIFLNIALDPPSLTLHAERHLLAQALVNLVDNAIKFTPGGGTIALEAKGAPDHVDIAVRDRGSGIPEADRRRVAQRFVRLDNAKDIQGSGLGLSLVAAVAKLHDGELILDDNRPGLKAVLRLGRRQQLAAPPADSGQSAQHTAASRAALTEIG